MGKYYVFNDNDGELREFTDSEEMEKYLAELMENDDMNGQEADELLDNMTIIYGKEIDFIVSMKTTVTMKKE